MKPTQVPLVMRRCAVFLTENGTAEYFGHYLQIYHDETGSLIVRNIALPGCPEQNAIIGFAPGVWWSYELSDVPAGEPVPSAEVLEFFDPKKPEA
jgi:hypothetical protein